MSNEKSELSKEEFQQLWKEATELASYIMTLDEQSKEKLSSILMGIKLARKEVKHKQVVELFDERK